MSVFGLLLFTLARAQTVEPTFAAASIRPSHAIFGRVEFKSGGRLTAVGVNVSQLVNAAYGLTGSGRLRKGSGCPLWIDSERFDLDAVAEEGTIPEHLDNAQLRERMQPLLQRLLAKRLHLVIRREPKELPVYELTVAKSGAKLAEAPISEAECRTSSDCHRVLGDRMQGLRGTAVSMADLAFALETWSDRPIVDASGIPGLFAVQLKPFATLKALPE
ncbi:MAG TPA: TIGR03435 family protein [Bryobacteraceae bacterium]|nr:TIGR03435 family protein [Bryobacteraceae bacterium]